MTFVRALAALTLAALPNTASPIAAVRTPLVTPVCAWGIRASVADVNARYPDTAAVYFTNSTTLDVGAVPGARVIARYPARAEDILMSGYLSGGAAIAGKAAAADAPLGRGRVVMFGFRPQYRGQSVGTFKMLFNALLAPADGAAGQRASR